MRRDEIVTDFLNLWLEDGAKGRHRSIEAYMLRFPGFEDVVRREYARVTARPGGDSETTGETEKPWRFGAFEIRAQLGRGGQGTVYRAWDTRLSREVVLKISRQPMTTSPRSWLRFRHEVGVISKLDHVGICPLLEAGQIDGFPWFAMHFMPGRSLAARLVAEREEHDAHGRRQGSDLERRTTEALRIARDVARALHYAHERGVAHRDVKPSNVLLVDDARPVLIDFGLAHDDDADMSISIAGEFFGTPAYMSPERFDGRDTDRRTDVWSLGVTLYEMLTLVRPFDGTGREELHRAITVDPLPDPRRHNAAVSLELKTVLETALAKAPDTRYSTAAQLADDLDALLAGRSVSVKPIGAIRRAWGWSRRNRAAAALIVVATIGLPTLAAAAAYSMPRILETQRTHRFERAEKLLGRGYVCLGEGDTEGAIAWFERSASEGAPAVERDAGIVVALLFANRLEEAERALEASPSRALDPLRAALFRRQGNDDAADALLAAATPPRDAVDHFLWGLEAWNRGGPEGLDRAYRHFGEAVLRAPSPRLLFHALRCCMATLRADRRGVEEMTGSLEALWGDSFGARLVCGTSLARVGNEEAALPHLRRAAELDPQDVLSIYNLGVYLSRRLRYAESEEKYLAVLALAPDHLKAHINLGADFVRRGDPRAALPYLESAIEIDPGSGSAWTNLALAYLSTGRNVECVAAARRATELLPENPTPSYLLVRALRRAGFVNEAAETGREAVVRFPADGPLYLELSLALSELRSPEAPASFEAAIRLNPDDPQPLINLGLFYYHTGKLLDAVEPLRRAAERAPTVPELHQYLGLALSRLGRAYSAVEPLRRWHELAPADGSVPLARALVDAGRPAESVPLWREARVRSAFEADVLLGLARALHAAGRDQEALDELTCTPHFGYGLARTALEDQCKAALRDAAELDHWLQCGGEPAHPVAWARLASRTSRQALAVDLWRSAIAGSAAAGLADFGGTAVRDAIGAAASEVARLEEAADWFERTFGATMDAWDGDELTDDEIQLRLARWLDDPVLLPIRCADARARLSPEVAARLERVWDEVADLVE